MEVMVVLGGVVEVAEAHHHASLAVAAACAGEGGRGERGRCGQTLRGSMVVARDLISLL